MSEKRMDIAEFREAGYLIDECPELRDRAAVWAGHPDYQERWRPDAVSRLPE